LVFDVSFYDFVPIPTGADRSGIVAVTPELSAPQLLLELGNRFEEFACCQGFEEPHDLPDAVLWMGADQQVDVVLVIAHLFDLQIVPLFNALDGSGNAPRHSRAQEGFAVLDREDQVVAGRS